MVSGYAVTSSTTVVQNWGQNIEEMTLTTTVEPMLPITPGRLIPSMFRRWLF
jgi:hypothetical protein